jgi:hypothetical protein
MIYNTFSRCDVEIKFLVSRSIRFKNDLIRETRVFHHAMKKEIEIFSIGESAFFDRFFIRGRPSKNTTHTRRRRPRERNHYDATTKRRARGRFNAKANDGRCEYHPVGRGRFGTTGDE